MKIHTAKLEHTTINNIFLFAGQVNSLCKELLCYPVRKESSAFLLFQKQCQRFNFKASTSDESARFVNAMHGSSEL